MTPRIPTWKPLAAGVVGLVVLLSGCANLSLDVIAPPVSSSPQLERGRLLYVTKCTACHAAEPVRNYSLADWSKIVPDMAKESKLNEQDTAAVGAYVRWVWQQPAPTSAPSR